MAPPARHGVIAVTGAAGFIGGWVVQRLLERGYRVRASVRRIDDDSRTGFLKAMPGFASGRLTLHEADLDQPGCFDALFAGAQAVAHLSHVSTYEDTDYLRRTCEHIIASVQKSDSVNRVVLTSSVAAVFAEADIQELARRPVLYEDRYPDESNPRRTPEKGLGYSMGKRLAEDLFREAAARSGRWDAIACCPGDNLGPILSAHQKGINWQGIVAGMLEGHFEQTGAYRPWMPVDVRDCADAHVALLESDRVRNGERYLAWSTETRRVEDLCRDIDRLLPELHHDTPGVTDSFPERIRQREPALRALWAGCDLRNDRIRALSPSIRFRPLDESLRDCVESLIAVGGISVRRRSPD